MTSIRQLLSGHTEAEQELASSYNSQQLVSLELGGQVKGLFIAQQINKSLLKLVVWTVLDHQRDYDQNLGLAHWGQVGKMISSAKHCFLFHNLGENGCQLCDRSLLHDLHRPP